MSKYGLKMTRRARKCAKNEWRNLGKVTFFRQKTNIF